MKQSLSAAALDHLPLRPTVFAVLAALAAGPRAGIDVLDHVNATVPKRGLLGPGTFYRLVRELRQAGLIERTEVPADDSSTDERRAHHDLTKLGRAVMTAETARLERTLALLHRSAPPRRTS